MPLMHASFRPNHVLYLFMAALLIFHFIGNAFFSYGYFRDELYYLACSDRLAIGYVDQPPLSVWVLAVWTFIAGDSLFAIRVIPALALAGTIWFTGQTVRNMGGNRMALAICSLCLVAAPILVAFGTYYSMNSLDILLWSIAIYIVSKINHRPHPRLWLLLGVIMGIGLLNKLSFLWFGTGLLVALLFSPLRKQLQSPWPYLSGGIAFLLFSPYIIWNLTHDMAHLEFMENAIRYKYNGITRMAFLSDLLLTENPFTLPVWIGGLFFFFIYRKGKAFRPLGLVFLTVFIILLVNGSSKAEYMAASFPILFAGGAVMIERMTSLAYLKWVPYALSIVLVSSFILFPLAKPLLSPEQYIAYTDTIGIKPGGVEGKELNELPQFFADMFGWEEMARTVSEVYKSLPPEVQTTARVFANNYGEAGAMEHYSHKYPMPYVISGHNNYYLWGPGKDSLNTVIIIGGRKEDHLESFNEVMGVTTHTAAYAMPYENNLTIYVCRSPKADTRTLWPYVKNYN